jgi:hypothetical protein
LIEEISELFLEKYIIYFNELRSLPRRHEKAGNTEDLATALPAGRAKWLKDDRRGRGDRLHRAFALLTSFSSQPSSSQLSS